MESEKSLSLGCEERIGRTREIGTKGSEGKRKSGACEKFERTRVAKNPYFRGRKLRFLVKGERKRVRALE